jgi:HEAT repeat protein
MDPVPPAGTDSPARSIPRRRPDATRRSWPLYVVPLLAVLLLVFAWVRGPWRSRAAYDPASLVRALEAGTRDSWQKAYVLAELLRDPSQDSVKYDRDICRALAALLAAEHAADPGDDARMRLKIFLCRALGEFRVPDGLPVLVDVAGDNTRDPSGQVRRAALEAIAVLAGQVGARHVRDQPSVVSTLLAASRAADDSHMPDRLTVSATFALGVVGGPQALERLTELLEHANSDVRYNAATGLARHGRLQALPTLLEMLDPANETAGRGTIGDATPRPMRVLAVTNAVRAATQLAAHHPTLDARPLIDALGRVSRCDWLPPRTRVEAQTALLDLAGRRTDPDIE